MSQFLFYMLVLACAVGLALQVGAIIINSNRRNKRRQEKHVIATVIKVQLESTTWARGWCILAAWTDDQTGQVYTFRSPLLRTPPTQRAGDAVPVVFDTNDPRYFHMELR
jgi:hypothetical protein